MPILDPNFDPRIFDGLSLVVLLSTREQRREPENGNGNVSLIRKWLHPSVTLAIALFAIQEYQASGKERAAMEHDITVLQQQVAGLQAANAAQDQLHAVAIQALTQRVNVHRDEIFSIRAEMLNHIQQDNARFRR